MAFRLDKVGVALIWPQLYAVPLLWSCLRLLFMKVVPYPIPIAFAQIPPAVAQQIAELKKNDTEMNLGLISLEHAVDERLAYIYGVIATFMFLSGLAGLVFKRRQAASDKYLDRKVGQMDEQHRELQTLKTGHALIEQKLDSVVAEVGEVKHLVTGNADKMTTMQEALIRIEALSRPREA